MITGAGASLQTAFELGKAALAARDSVKLRDALSEVLDHLAKARLSLADVSLQTFELAQKLQVSEQERRDLLAAIEERGNYELVEVSAGNFAMRPKVHLSESSLAPGGAEPLHYLCQACFDKGRKTVLQRAAYEWGVTWVCHPCKIEIQG